MGDPPGIKAHGTVPLDEDLVVLEAGGGFGYPELGAIAAIDEGDGGGGVDGTEGEEAVGCGGWVGG